mgnify:CR=1 FL=1
MEERTEGFEDFTDDEIKEEFKFQKELNKSFIKADSSL